MKAGDVLDNVRKRVRGEGTTAHPDSVALPLLSTIQRVVNISTKSLLPSIDFETTPSQVVYALSDISPDISNVVDVRYQNARLSRVPNFSLLAPTYGYSWFRSVADRPSAYCSIGQTLLILWPATSRPVTVSVKYVKATAELTRASDLEISPIDIPAAAFLLELTLLLRQRSLTEATVLLKELKGAQAGS